MTSRQWTILLLLVTCSFICLVDRTNLSVAATDIQRDLRLSDSQLGLLLSGFFFTYATFQLLAISGWVADRFHVSWVLAAGLLVAALVRFTPLGRRFAAPVFIVGMCVVSAAGAAHSAQFGGLDSPHFYGVYTVAPILIPMLVSMPVRIVGTCATVGAFVVVFALRRPGLFDHPMVHVPATYLVAIGVISVLTGRYIKALEERSFLDVARLEAVARSFFKQAMGYGFALGDFVRFVVPSHVHAESQTAYGLLAMAYWLRDVTLAAAERRQPQSVEAFRLRLLAENRWPFRLHATYDETITRALDVFERLVAWVEQVGLEQFNPFMRMVLLQAIDSHWREHLAALDYLRQGIHLRGYAQKNPKQEYKREAFELFSQLLDVVKMEVTRLLLTVRIQSQDEVAQAASAIEEQASHLSNVTYTHPNEDGSVSAETDPATLVAEVTRVGRNDPCPCGSGKKYKSCHGRLA